MTEAFTVNSDIEMEVLQFSLGLGLGMHMQGDIKNGNKCTWVGQHKILMNLLERVGEARGEVGDNVRRPPI